MASKQQATGMRGVYLVAAQLTKLGHIASPTSRSAHGADILATSHSCAKACSVQVKTNARTHNFWNVGKNAKHMTSRTHLYAFVNIRSLKAGELIDYYIVPSSVVAKKMRFSTGPKSDWHSFYREDAEAYKDKWSLFGSPE